MSILCSRIARFMFSQNRYTYKGFATLTGVGSAPCLQLRLSAFDQPQEAIPVKIIFISFEASFTLHLLIEDGMPFTTGANRFLPAKAARLEPFSWDRLTSLSSIHWIRDLSSFRG